MLISSHASFIGYILPLISFYLTEITLTSIDAGTVKQPDIGFIRGAIQGTFTTAVVSKSALNLLYYRKSPPGTIYYGKKSVRELFTTDSEFTLQVKTCSKRQNLRQNLLQGVYPVVIFFYG